MRKTIFVLAMIIVLATLTGCGADKKQTVKLEDMSFSISDKWEKTMTNNGEPYPRLYDVHYKYKGSDIDISINYADELGDVYDIDDNLLSQYTDYDESTYSIDKHHMASIYQFTDLQTIHVITEKAVYVFDIRLDKDSPDTFNDILKSMKTEGGNERL